MMLYVDTKRMPVLADVCSEDRLWALSLIACKVFPEKWNHVWSHLQTLLETHMAMSLDAMQQCQDLTPADRGTQSLPGGHLPVRGFYRIKPINSRQLQNQRSSSASFCGIPFWVLPKPQNDSSRDLRQPSVECDVLPKGLLTGLEH